MFNATWDRQKYNEMVIYHIMLNDIGIIFASDSGSYLAKLCFYGVQLEYYNNVNSITDQPLVLVYIFALG